MKLKILIFPLVVVVIMYLSIWVIVPKYDSIKQIKAKLAETNNKLADIERKEKNAASLMEKLNSNSEDQNLIVKYLPAEKQDEYILASINSLASINGVSISSIGFSEEAPIQDIEVLYDEKGNVMPKEEDFTKKFSTNVEVIGSYEKIRMFLFSLDTITRLNEFALLSISSSANAESPDALHAKVSLSFSYLPKKDDIVKINEDFFASSEFDMSVAQEIRKKAIIEVPKIDIGSIGRNNLFAL